MEQVKESRADHVHDTRKFVQIYETSLHMFVGTRVYGVLMRRLDVAKIVAVFTFRLTSRFYCRDGGRSVYPILKAIPTARFGYECS